MDGRGGVPEVVEGYAYSDGPKKTIFWHRDERKYHNERSATLVYRHPRTDRPDLASEERDAMQEDVAEMLRALDLGDHARPKSCHEVIQEEILPEIRRLRTDRPEEGDMDEQLREDLQVAAELCDQQANEWRRRWKNSGEDPDAEAKMLEYSERAQRLRDLRDDGSEGGDGGDDA